MKNKRIVAAAALAMLAVYIAAPKKLSDELSPSLSNTLTEAAASINQAQQTAIPQHAPAANWTDPKLEIGTVCSLALDAFMQQADGMTDAMAYIAVETSDLPVVSAQDKARISQHLSKYMVDVMHTSLEQLGADGQLKEARFIKGVLLRIDSAEATAKKVLVKGSVYKSAKAAIGMEATIEYKDGRWQTTKAISTWIS